MTKILHIEIMKNCWNKKTYDISSGDIAGKIEYSNCSKKQVMKFIEEELKNLEVNKNAKRNT